MTAQQHAHPTRAQTAGGRGHNGIDRDVLQGTIASFREHPQAAAVTVRTRHRWDDGFGFDGRAEEVEQAGEIMPRTHTFRTDWPAPHGRDSGPTPGAESLLAAIGACVGTTYVVKAASQGVQIDELEVRSEGRLDLQGLFELDSVRPGFSKVTITVVVRSDADAGVLEELGRTVTRTSPVYDAIAHPVPIELSVQRVA